MIKFIKRPIVIALLLMMIAFTISYTISPIFVMIFAKNEISALLIAQIFTYILPIILILKFSIYQGKTIFLIESDFNRINRKMKINLMIHAIFIFLIVFIIKNIVELLRAKSGVVHIEETVNFSLLSFSAMILVYALIPAIIEEILYKSILSKVAIHKFSRYIIVVVCFTLVHQGPVQIISAFIFANLMYILYVKEQNTRKFIWLHFIYNLLVIIFSNYMRLPFQLSILVHQINYHMLINGYVFILLSVLFLIILIYYLVYDKISIDESYQAHTVEYRDLTHHLVYILLMIVFIVNFLIINYL